MHDQQLSRISELAGVLEWTEEHPQNPFQPLHIRHKKVARSWMMAQGNGTKERLLELLAYAHIREGLRSPAWGGVLAGLITGGLSKAEKHQRSHDTICGTRRVIHLNTF